MNTTSCKEPAIFNVALALVAIVRDLPHDEPHVLQGASIPRAPVASGTPSALHTYTVQWQAAMPLHLPGACPRMLSSERTLAKTARARVCWLTVSKCQPIWKDQGRPCTCGACPGSSSPLPANVMRVPSFHPGCTLMVRTSCSACTGLSHAHQHSRTSMHTPLQSFMLQGHTAHSWLHSCESKHDEDLARHKWTQEATGAAEGA